MATPTTTDPVLETRIFWDRYKREIAIALGILLVASIGYTAFRLMEQRREAVAAVALGAAKTTDDYRRVAAEYPTSTAAASARLFAADELRKNKDFAGANVELQKFVEKYPNHEMMTTARMAIAANLEAMGKADDALASYQKIAASSPRDFLAPLAMISQVHLLQAKGQTDEARKVCENVMSQHSDSYLAGEASRMLRKLKPAKTVAAGSASQSPTNSAPPQPAAQPSGAPSVSQPTAPPQAKPE